MEEETALTVRSITSPVTSFAAEPNVGIEVSDPVAVVAGVDGAFPSLHVVIECTARGEPMPLDGETADPTWWPIDDLRTALEDRPSDFVWQSHAILSAWLQRQSQH